MGKFYKTPIFLALLYGIGATKFSHIDKTGVTEMHMLRWMSGKILEDRVPNLLNDDC